MNGVLAWLDFESSYESLLSEDDDAACALHSNISIPRISTVVKFLSFVINRSALIIKVLES